jgi:hypothetical protein
LEKISWLRGSRRKVVVAVVIAGVLSGGVLFRWSPYAIAYNNPIFLNIRPLNQQGWGEGLDKAADWFNQHPLGEKLTVASWYEKALAPYFKGKAFSLSARDDYRVAYVVTYRNMGGRAGDDQASNVLDEYVDQEPVHVIKIGGVPYVWVYETNNVGVFTKHVGEVTNEVEVGQIVEPGVKEWEAVEIGFATYSDRPNTEDVVLEVKESLESREVIRRVVVNAKDIKDNQWQEFRFEPLKVELGQKFYIGITSPNSYAGNAVTVRYIDEDIRPGQMYLKRGSGVPQPKEGDVAYRVLPLRDVE